jgi:hypothetical protein
VANDEESDESRTVQYAFDQEAVLLEGAFSRRSEEANRGRHKAEEVEISCTPVYRAMHDEGGTTGKSEIFSFRKTGDDPGYSLL